MRRKDLPEARVVHDVRKAMKRWRAFLRLVEPMVGTEARQLRLEARDIARAMASARDLQAALDALRDLEKHGSGDVTSLGDARALVEHARGQAESKALGAALRDEALRAIDHAADAVSRWNWSEIGFGQLADGLAAAYRRARRAIPDDWDAASDEGLHALRQRIVVHRYQMQLVEPLWPRFGKLWIAEAQRLRERLGARQDLAVLRRLAAADALLADWQPALAPLIEARQEAHVKAAAKLAGRLFAERPRAFRARIAALWHGSGRKREPLFTPPVGADGAAASSRARAQARRRRPKPARSE